MPNQIVTLYRKYLADTGQRDDATDYDLTQKLGDWAKQNRPELFDVDPTFGEEYAAIRDANAPSLPSEFGRAVKSGTQGLAATALGGLGLLTGSDYLMEKAASFEQDAGENAPTIGTLEDIAPGRSGIGSLFSRDTARYALAKTGSVVPSIVEGVAAAAAGAAAGSAIAPGPGTVAGAAEGLVARGLIKSAVRSLVSKGVAEELVAKGVIKEATEEALEAAVRAGTAAVADKVGLEAMAIGAKRGLAATNLANSFLLNAGDVSSEGADRPTSIALGMISAIPDSILPGYIVGRLFPGVSAAKAAPLAKQYLGDRAMKGLQAAGIVGVEAGTEYFQEAVNVVARNIKDGKEPTDFNEADLVRFREAAIAGGFGGALAAPSVLMTPPSNTTADIPAVPVPPPPRFAAPISNPLAGLSETPDTAEAFTPVDQALDQNAASLLDEQQTEIERQLAADRNRQQLVNLGLFPYEDVQAMSNMEVQAELQRAMNAPPTAPAEELGRQMAGETQEVAAEQSLRRTAFSLAGAPVPDASDPVQADQRAAAAMAGNVPAELAEPLPATPVPVQKEILPTPASQAETYEQVKLREVSEAVKVPGIRYQYSVFPMEMTPPGMKRTVQIDIIGPDGAALGSTNLDQLEALGVKLPTVPDTLKTGRYTPEQITLSQLPAEISTNLGLPPPAAPGITSPAGSAGAQPLVATAPPPRGSAATESALPAEQQGPGAGTVPQTAPVVQSIGTRANISAQRKLIKELRAGAEKVAGSPQAAKLQKRINAEQEKLVQLMETKKDSVAPQVGYAPNGEPDLISDISEHIGRLRTESKEGKESFGELDGASEALQFGAARLLRGGVGGMAWDEAVDIINETTGRNFQSVGDFQQAIQNTVAQRKKLADQVLADKKKMGKERYQARVESAALQNEGRAISRRPDGSIPIEQIGVGGKFHLNNEKFSIIGTDEGDGGVVMFIIKDGHTFSVPEGTAFYPDRNSLQKPKVKKAKGPVSSDEDPFFGVEAAQPAAAAPVPGGEMFPSSDVASTAPTALDRANAAARAATPPPPAPIPDAVAPKPAAPVTASKFQFGPVVEAAPTMDFRQTPGAESLTAEQWVQAIRENLKLGPRLSRESSKADTKIAVALQSPDGRVILTGVTLPDRTLDAAGQNIIKEPTLQRMGFDQGGKRVLSVSGNKPALVVDVVRAGYKPLAILHFVGDAGRIHEVFASQKDFDAAWGVTPKTQGKNVQPPALRAAIPRAQQTEQEINREIEKLGEELLRAKPEERPAIIDRIRGLYAKLDEITRNNQDLSGDTHPPEYRQDSGSSTAIQSQKVSQFQRVIANLQQLGMRVDVFSREFLAQSTAEEIQRRLDQITQQAAEATDPAMRAELGRRAAVLQERLQSVNEAAGVTYSPWHVALAADDVGNASTNNLVTLLHEAAEALTMRLTVEQRGAVRTAINSAMETLRARAAVASEATGVPLARESGPHDLMAETLAQELTAAGIPDAPNLAQAIMRWLKDVYYRTAMALQAAFGAQPNPETALNWYENQLQREVYGDFNYEFSSLLDRFLPSPIKERVQRFEGRNGTPGGIPDFLDPVAGIIRQPQVETINRESLNWNLEYQLPGHPGQELDIPDPEARARIKGAVLNGLSELYERLRVGAAPDMAWNDFFGTVKRPAEEDPKLLVADLNQRIAGSGDAKMGGERMTDPMNREARTEYWGRVRKFGLSLRRMYARTQQTVADATRQLSEAAQEINKLEGDLRNAALHDDRLRARAKELVKGLAKSIARGRGASHLQGELAEAIRQEEGLLESDPIPAAYEAVLKALTDGQTPIFDYVRAIAELDLPLTEMTNREVMAAIRGGAEQNPQLARLAANKPLAVALSTLARRNADQLDQIQLGWLRDTSRFREIHDELEAIKTATGEQLRELGRKIDERGKASGLSARLQASYVKKRRRQQAASDRIAAAEERQALIEKLLGPVDQETADAAQAAGGAQYEWTPQEGAVWTAMRQDAEGNWRRHERVLRFKPDGSAVDGDQLRQDIAANVVWLGERREQEGKPRYNQIAAQTYALQLLDARGQQQRTWNSGILNAVDRFVRTPIASARSLGGPAMQRVIQMLNRYQFILRSYQKTLEAPAAEWQYEFSRLRDASGLKDNGEFIDQVYRPVMYFLSVNPGLEEGPAIRQATALARRALQAPREDFNERFAAFIRKTRENERNLLGIAEQYGVFVEDKRLGELRRAVPRGILTGMRSLNGGLVDVLTKDMQAAGWKLTFDEDVKDGVRVKTNPRAATFASLDPRNADGQEESEAIWANLDNADGLRALLGRLFTPAITGQWLEPFIRKPGQEPFSFEGEAIPQELVGQAWAQAGGDVLGWIDRLGQMLEVQMDDKGRSPASIFRLAMFRNLDHLFGHEARIAYEASQTPGLLDPHGAKPHALMDARVSDLLPPEHVEFATYEPESMHRLLARVAYHGAFGRNAKNIQAAFRENMNYLKGRQSEYQTLSSLHTSTAGRQAEAAARGWNYDELRTADKRYQELKDFQAQLESVLGVSANSGPLGDFGKAMSVINFMVGQIVDNPKTAAYNLLSPAMRPFAQRSLGPKTILNTARVYADILQTGLGSLFQSFGLHLFKAGRYADTIGNSEGRAFSNLPTSVILSDIGHQGDNQEGLNKWLVKPLKIARNLQRKGLQVGTGEATEFPRLAVVPGLGVINSISNIEIQASGASLAREFEQLVRDGIAYMAQHPDAANNPSFQFKASDLYGRFDQGLFDWWKQKTVEYNLGNLEDIVRHAAKRTAEDPTQRTLSDDQAMTLSMMNQNEFSLNSSINTTPAWLMTNPFLRMAMPLMRWPLTMMSAVHEAAKPKAGENSVKPMLRAISTLALWNLPLGIAFSLLMDEYDKKILGKKSNLANVSGLSALPLVGIPLSLLNSKDPISELEAVLVRSARAGNVYGLGADVAAQTLVGLDPASGQRAVSLDQRVLVMSQLTNLSQALLAYRNQGYANWGSVARPLLMAMGGNGVLHSVDITNNLLGLDNAQSRLVQRASSSNWIRAAAQELDIDVRKGAGSAPPTPMSAHTREMYLAALANDRADFLEQYRLALNAAREKVADDPSVAGADREREAKQRVLSSWKSRSPMSVLASKPTAQQVQQMLGIMDPAGQQTVRETMQRYDAFTQMIAPSPVERYFQRQMNGQQSQFSAESLRRRMAGEMLFSGR